MGWLSTWEQPARPPGHWGSSGLSSHGSGMRPLRTWPASAGGGNAIGVRPGLCLPWRPSVMGDWESEHKPSVGTGTQAKSLWPNSSNTGGSCRGGSGAAPTPELNSGGCSPHHAEGTDLRVPTVSPLFPGIQGPASGLCPPPLTLREKPRNPGLWLGNERKHGILGCGWATKCQGRPWTAAPHPPCPHQRGPLLP